MLAFLTNKAPFSAIFQIFVFLTQIRKNYVIFVICTKNEPFCENGSINILIWADEVWFYQFFGYYVIMTSQQYSIENLI